MTETLLDTLTRISADVQRAQTVTEVLDTVGQQLLEAGYSFVALQLDGALLKVRYRNGPTVSTALGLKVPWKVPVASELDRIRGLGRAVFVEDTVPLFQQGLKATLGSSHSLEATVHQTNLARAVIAPITLEGADWAALVVGRNELTAGSLPALSLFCAQVGAVLNTAQIHENLASRNRALAAVHALSTLESGHTVESAVERLMETVAQATESDVAALHRYEPATREYAIVGQPWNYRGPITKDYLRFPAERLAADFLERRSVAISATKVSDLRLAAEGYSELAVVLLSVGEQVLGLLSLTRRAEQPYTAAQLATAELLGVQVAAWLERARLNEEAERRIKQLSLLYEMTTAGGVARQVRPLIDRLLTQMLDAFPVDMAALHFREGGELKLVGSKQRVALAKGPAAFLRLTDSTIEARAAALRSVQCERAYAAAPLLANDNLVGVLSVWRAQDVAFTLDQLKLLESCAVHMAVVLEQVRLYDDLKKSYDDLARAQAELVRHERLAALGELAAVMAHEVRNPLGVIFNSLTSLRRLLKPDGDSDMLLNIIGEEADRLNRIVGDLLDFAKPYEPVKKPIAVEPLVSSAVDAALQAVKASNLSVVKDLPADLPEALLDGHLIRQALINLVVNAIQAMPKGGTVTVAVRWEETDGWMQLVIDVQDQGVGLSAQVAERIFQPFFTTKATGTGLGLAVVKRIVDAHHGDIAVRSNASGTTFSVRLPAGPSKAVRPAGWVKELSV